MSSAGAEIFFERITARPRRVIAAAMLTILAGAAGLLALEKDTSVEAFIPPGHASLAVDHRIEQVFGISRPIAIAVVANDGGSIFRPALLSLVDELTAKLATLENIRIDRITSLATESSIDGDGAELYIEPYIEAGAIDAHAAADARERWSRMEPHRRTLVSEDESAALVLGELVDEALAADTYEQVLAMVSGYGLPNAELHVAGPAAVSGYLSRYIDEDARRLQPLVLVLVLGFVYLAFRRFAALAGPVVVVVGAAACALGLMGWSGVAYFAITNALPVIIVAISVADAIHVLSAYYQLRELDPALPVRTVVVKAMASMVRPITLTTVTTIAGFTGIAAASIMPPITWFGVFAAAGVALAWAFSILVLPNVLLVVEPGRSPAFASWADARPSLLGRRLASIPVVSAKGARRFLAAVAAGIVVAALAASGLRVDRNRIENFAADEPVRQADELINERFAGSASLNVLVESEAPDGLLSGRAMAAIHDLQARLESLPHVRKTLSIVDYLREMETAFDGRDGSPATAQAFPQDGNAIAQYLFLYDIAGDPGELDDEIDANNRSALVRAILDARYFTETRPVVESMQAWIDETFRDSELSAQLAGEVNVSYHWMKSLSQSHFESVLLSLALVLATASLMFRSLALGIISVLPVAITVLLLYASMALLGIHLEPATSMFAAIALGVGVDFAIHLVDRLEQAMSQEGGGIAQACETCLPSVARACFFNSAALGLGFSVLMVSDLPTLIRFGGLVTLASLASYVAALTIVPALLALRQSRGARTRARAVAGTLSAAMLAAILPSPGADAIAEERADEIAKMVAARPEAPVVKRRIAMTLTDRRGRTEERVAIAHSASDADAEWTRITFLEPKRIAEFSFLSRDAVEANGASDRWLFVPFRRKVRRIPASGRGDSFFGTDFTYDDIQSDLKFDPADWRFEYLGREETAETVRHQLGGAPRDRGIARELGYGGFRATVDAATWLPLEIEFTDLAGRPLKTVSVEEHTIVEGIVTPLRIRAVNHRTGHSTVFDFDDIEYPDELPATLFDPQRLALGLPAGAD